MKKLINSRDRMPDDMIDGFVAAYPGIVARGANPRIVRRAQPKDRDSKTVLLIGNGCGHEPIAMGFVGPGLLDANVVGDVFAAPSPDLILEGIREVTGKAGAVLLISRHEGDVINGNAAAMMAEDENLKVVPLLMYDDISSAPKGSEDERRGAAGTIFVYKILGAAAEAGRALDELVQLGEDVRSRTRTLAAAVAPGISPLTGEPMFSLPDDEIYIGMGVHGEPGVGRRKVGPARDLIAFMLGELLEDRPIAADTPTIVLVNGSGGTTQMELLTVFNEVATGLDKLGIPNISPMIGSFSTTQEMAGFSISLLTPTPEMLEPVAGPTVHPEFSRHPQRGGDMSNHDLQIRGVAVDAGSGLAAAIKSARGASAQPDDLLTFKRAVLTTLGPSASTVLVDANCGPDLLADYPASCQPMMAYEADVYHISDADRITVLPDNLDVADFPRLGVKQLKFFMYYAPDDDPALNARKHDLVELVGKQCAANNLNFLMEPLIYHPDEQPGTASFAAIKPELVRRAVEVFAQPRYNVAILKLEVPVDLNFVAGFGEPQMGRDAALAAFRDAAAPANGLPIVYLSAGVPFDWFSASLQMAREAGVDYAGFMCGRSIWSEAVGVFGADGEQAVRDWLADIGLTRLKRLIEVTQ
ncbi:tagatose 1,6-diphosphate aldolase [Devosia algicola]|uniref:Tagatose 1,6-diphosphate aldolase n=1 Tax=Devosia algicola TaxID=3026418 RepID=A0ABY7YP02_9HYPH|nr:tagatose 1,6-diphosphate aldolase [Devosia algicola]WDR02878.1 tagatose 1,6-diphosphate aldolase [Devosia algicola]